MGMIKEAAVDRLKIRIYENRSQMGSDAAKRAGETIRGLLAEKEFMNVIFAAAPSQNEFLAALIQVRGIEWNRINAFHMDEYVGLPEGSVQSFGHFLKERIFSKLPFKSVHYLNGNARDLERECQRYADLLNKYPSDMVFMGIGENTHIAFNDPHVADFNDPYMVKPVNLDMACRQQQVNDGCFDKIEDVPERALTLTVPSLLQAAHIFCMVPGENKAQAVYYTLCHPITESHPSTVLRKHPNALLYLDKDSAKGFVDSGSFKAH